MIIKSTHSILMINLFQIQLKRNETHPQCESNLWMTPPTYKGALKCGDGTCTNETGRQTYRNMFIREHPTEYPKAINSPAN